MADSSRGTMPGPQMIGDLIDGQAQQNSEAVAIAAPGRRPLSYGRLRLQLHEVGGALRGSGIGRNERVALAMPNGPQMAVAFAAVSSFAACAPLNPAYPFDEFDFYLYDLGVSALIAQCGTCAAAVAAAQKRSIPIIELTPATDGTAGIFRLNIPPERASKGPLKFSDAQDKALVLHTSGTTSRPKLVELTHGQLIASAANIAAGLQLTPADRCLNVMPLFHIHGLVGALLASMSVGGSVVCTAGFDAAKFFDWLQECRPTWYTAVPTIHQAILSCAKADPRITEQRSLRFIRSCSAALPAAVARELEDVFRVPVVEAYGMTEAAHQISSNPLPPKERKTGSVGLPTGTEVAVSDGERRLARGEVGEIAIRGATVIAGYANDTAFHEENFTAGWLRTGDQGFVDEDGYIYLTGRLKEIINRGGEKIAPKEIDEALLGHPEIAQAAAFRVPHASLGDDVGAAVVLRHGSELTESSIREYLMDRIVAFKVPGQIFIVGEIPKGATGKLDRNKLSERFTAHTPERVAETHNHLEETVAGIYREVLGAKAIGPGDNFFVLGGDSLRATQVINRVRAIFELNLSIATIFRRPTVSDLAMEIAQMMSKEDQKASETN